MQTEISEPNEQKAIREEIQSLKDRINLIEAILDIIGLMKNLIRLFRFNPKYHFNKKT